MRNIDYKDLIGKHKSYITDIFGEDVLPESGDDLLLYKLQKNVHGRDTILSIHLKANIVYSLFLKNHFWYEKMKEFGDKN